MIANVFKRVGKDGRATWCIRYKDPITGKDVKKATRARTKREAEIVKVNLEQELMSGSFTTHQQQREVRFFEICDDFLNYSRAHKRSWIRDETTVSKFKRQFGDIPCEQISRPMIEHYITLRRHGEGGLGVPAEPSTINRELACLRTILRRAHSEEKIIRNPMRGFKLLDEDNVRDRVISEAEYNRLLFAAPTHLRPVIIMAWETGMRRGEILNLTWSQVDLRNNTIKLAGSQTKSGKKRTVPISRILKSTLEDLPRKGEWVFNYRRQHLRDIRTGFLGACQKAGIRDFRFHDLRHCFVTGMRRKGIPDRVIMAITGHQTMECFRRYDAITEDDLKAAVSDQG